MFEHLDDPEGLAPGRSELAGVLARAQEIRQRRRWGLAVATCCVLLAASVGFFLSRPPGPGVSPPADDAFNLVTGPLPLGSPVPNTALVDVEFENPQNGFALAVHRDEMLLAASEDGGSTWQVRNIDLPGGLGPADGYPGQMEFVDGTGYLWGARTRAGAPLWVTHDAGISWQQAAIGPYVLDVSAIDLDVWALTAACPTTQSGPCTVSMDQSLDGGVTWQVVGPVASSVLVADAGAANAFELARITRDRSYVLSDLGTTEHAAWFLQFTDDGGITWLNRPLPCAGADAQGAEIAASSTTDLWLLCGSASAGPGAQNKQLYRSGDGGVTWRLAATTGAGAGPTASPAQDASDPLPVNGYVAPFAPGHRNLAVASPATAWLYPARAGLFKTADGGATWVPVASLADAGFPSGGQGNVTFVSATQGWICSYGVGLWHTVDGIHWSPLGTS
jgi:hypothetical protein